MVGTQDKLLLLCVKPPPIHEMLQSKYLKCEYDLHKRNTFFASGIGHQRHLLDKSSLCCEIIVGVKEVAQVLTSVICSVQNFLIGAHPAKGLPLRKVSAFYLCFHFNRTNYAVNLTSCFSVVASGASKSSLNRENLPLITIKAD